MYITKVIPYDSKIFTVSQNMSVSANIIILISFNILEIINILKFFQFSVIHSFVIEYIL